MKLYEIAPALRFALEAVWCWQALAMRGLRDESRNVYRALTGGTLEQARAAVARIVGRDTAALSAGLDLGAGSGPLDHTLGGKNIFTWMNGAPDAIQE